MYNRHRCPCGPCREANRAYHRTYTRPDRKDRTVVPMVDAGQARERVAVLRAAEMTMAEIADACAVNRSGLDFAVYGRNGKPPAKIRATTVAAANHLPGCWPTWCRGKVDPDVPMAGQSSTASAGEH
jgi:hypothetical protein